MRKIVFALVTLVVAVAGCAQPAAQQSAELTARAESWIAHYNAGDFDALMELYAEDARLMPPNAETVQGHAAIRADFQKMSDAGLSGTLETVEAMAVGDLGYRVGTFTLSAPDGSLVDRGKYIEVWRLVEGEWKMSSDMYSSDLPPAPAGSRIFGIHEVADSAVWLAAWMDDDARRAQFADNGIASVHVFQDPDKPSTTGLLLDVVDMEAFQAFLSSDEGVAAAAADTVRMDTLRILAEVR